MKKRMVSLLLTLTMAGSLLAGCGNSEEAVKETQKEEASSAAESKAEETAVADSGDREEVIFWAWWRSEARKPYIDQMVAEFNASQDKYFVKFEVTPWGDIFTKNIAAIAAGNPCDVIVNSMSEVALRAENGQVECLDEYMTDEMKNSFYESCMDSCYGEDGKVYAVPFSIDTRAMYYNKAHFAEAGIDPASIKTWDDLEKAAIKLDKKNGDKYERIGLMPTMGSGVDTWFVNASGGQCWYDEETLKPTVNSEANREAFAWIARQNERYGQDAINEINAAFSNGMADPFASGVLSMIVNVSSYISPLRNTAPDLDYGVFKLPEFKEGNGHASNGGGFVMEIPKGAKNPDGAFEFIKYATSREVQDFLSVSIGDFSARNDFDETTEFFKQPNIAELSDSLAHTCYFVTPNEFKGFTEIINPLIEEGTLGIKTTEEALDNAQKAFEQFLENQQ